MASSSDSATGTRSPGGHASSIWSTRTRAHASDGSAAERRAFTDAYGWDVTAWPGYPLLREMRDLHTLGAFIDRAARGDARASAELRHRVASLRTGDSVCLWHAH